MNEKLSLEEKALADYVSSHAVQYVHAPAIEYLGVTISYARLNLLANQLANALRDQGVGKGDVIGLHLPNIPQYLIGLVAASKLGAIASGVSPLLSPTELVHQVNDANIKVLLTLDQTFNPVFPAIDGQVSELQTVLVFGAIDVLPGWKRFLARITGKIEVPELKPLQEIKVLSGWATIRSASSDPVQTPVRFDDTILIQYTGGTTGKPKGAELSLLSVQSEVTMMYQLAPYDAGKETIASAFPYFHTAGLVVSILGMVHASRLLVIPDPRDVKHFCAQMKKFPPSIFSNVPTLFQMLLEEPAFREIDFSRLQMAISGAAPASPEMIHQLEEVIGKGKLCEGYGMTETCAGISMNPPGAAKVGTVGPALNGVEIRIVDVEDDERELPAGEAGEIIVSGTQLLKGYLNRPEATAEALRERDGRTWLYTGDIGQLDEDGYLTICDRAKDMLIVGGYKVFSVEVESKLAELDFIEMSAVIGTPDTARPGNDIVNLYVQLKPGAKGQDEAVLREKVISFCREQMAAYKVPKQVHFIDELPLTAVGKLDKKALRS